MTKINPLKISWLAPIENTDGTAITEPLSYRMLVDGVDFLDFPGTLNADGKYEEYTTSMNLPSNEVLSITLKAFYASNPDIISIPSNVIEVMLGVAAPNAPLELSAE